MGYPPPKKNRAGQTALAENGAERRRRQRKGRKGRIIVVVRSPCQENDPADAHTGTHKLVLESASPAWSVHLDAPGQRHGQQPVSGIADPGSVDTMKTHSDPQRVRMCKVERPTSAAKSKQTNTMAWCQTRITWAPNPMRSGVRDPSHCAQDTLYLRYRGRRRSMAISWTRGRVHLGCAIVGPWCIFRSTCLLESLQARRIH